MSAMYARIAWRNIFRNRRRSFIVIGSVAVGVAGSIFMNLFMFGMAEQMVSAGINSYLGHIQIHKRGYADNPVVGLTMMNPDSVLNLVADDGHGHKGYSPRVMSRGLAQSAANTAGIMLIGVDAARETLLTSVSDRIIDGRFLSGQTSRRRKEVVIGEALAQKLNVRVGRRIVIVAQSHTGEMGSGAFRVVGIFRMPSEDLNKTFIWINLPDAQRMLNVGTGLSEVMVMLDSEEGMNALRDSLAEQLGTSYEVRTWRDASRQLVEMVELFDVSVYFFMAIAFIGAAFGVVNTMLMSVFERMREFGILRAIGTSPWALFRIVVYEAVYIGILGVIAGSILMTALHFAFFADGLDLSIFAKSLAMFGSDAVIMPVLDMQLFVATIIAVEIMTIVSSLWPAFRAARLEPVETMRSH